MACFLPTHLRAICIASNWLIAWVPIVSNRVWRVRLSVCSILWGSVEAHISLWWSTMAICGKLWKASSVCRFKTWWLDKQDHRHESRRCSYTMRDMCMCSWLCNHAQCAEESTLRHISYNHTTAHTCTHVHTDVCMHTCNTNYMVGEWMNVTK